jgi:6-phosphogluconolactonase
MVKTALLNHVPVPNSNIHRIEAERNPRKAAHHYQKLLTDFFGKIPHFDLIFLGMGDDGHTASLFPGTKALHETEALVAANYVDKLAAWRITLTRKSLIHARTILFLVSGANKAKTLKEVILGEYNPENYPSQLIRPLNGELYWFIDQQAAALLGYS